MSQKRRFAVGIITIAVILAVGAGWYFFRDSRPPGEIELSLPIACTLGEDCFIQQYVDLDPSPAANDYNCGSATYNGHKGTDFRIRTLADVTRDVPVIASAAGRVTALRDDVADHLVKSEADRAAIKDKDCGNGVVLTHSGGWQTQYCHLREGSVAVKKGAEVQRGDRLGFVGYSGNAAFPHVHLSLRKDGKAVDPFRGIDGGPACGEGLVPLWSPQVLAQMRYEPSKLLGIGFSDAAVKTRQLETGSLQAFVPSTSSKALVSWGWAINLKKDDLIVTALHSPQGEIARNSTTLKSDKAQSILFAGKKRPAGGWTPGRYRAVFSIVRDGKALIEAEQAVEID
jgi:hypothetical protein